MIENIQHLVTFVGHYGYRYADVLALATTSNFVVNFFESVDQLYTAEFATREEAEKAAINYAYEGKTIW